MHRCRASRTSFNTRLAAGFKPRGLPNTLQPAPRPGRPCPGRTQGGGNGRGLPHVPTGVPAAVRRVRPRAPGRVAFSLPSGFGGRAPAASRRRCFTRAVLPASVAPPPAHVRVRPRGLKPPPPNPGQQVRTTRPSAHGACATRLPPAPPHGACAAPAPPPDGPAPDGPGLGEGRVFLRPQRGAGCRCSVSPRRGWRDPVPARRLRVPRTPSGPAGAAPSTPGGGPDGFTTRPALARDPRRRRRGAALPSPALRWPRGVPAPASPARLQAPPGPPAPAKPCAASEASRPAVWGFLPWGTEKSGVSEAF